MKDKFYGRHRHLNILKNQLNQGIARLVVIRGRRRIGKSRLSEEFSKSFKTAYLFVGLPPEKEVSADMERQHFANDLARQTGITGLRTDDWDILFNNLAQCTQKGKVLIIFDEINWMAKKDPTFLGKLKTAWDTQFKKNPQLMMILSGSMSSWIQDNILNSTGFFGRVDLDMVLRELPLHDCNQFWGAHTDRIDPYEKFKILAVTGGVPRYLENVNSKLSAEENIRRLFFRKESLFFKEFAQIFTDIFSTRAPIYEKIVKLLSKGAMEQSDILSGLGVEKSGVYSEYLDELVETGYISRDNTWKIKQGQLSKLSQYRLSDNYLRFYLKCIEPNKQAILNDRGDIPENWYSSMGLQFENLVLNNRKQLIKLLDINDKDVLIDNPFFVRGGKTQQGVQIDYLIQTKFNNLYLCEIKFKKDKIGMDTVNEVQEKMERLPLPRGFSIRTVLIHVNGVNDNVLDSQFFSYIVNFSDLLSSKV